TQIERADRRLLPAESLARAGRPGHRCPGKALPVADAGGPRDEGAGARRVRFPRPPGARGAATLAPRPAATRRTPARLREHPRSAPPSTWAARRSATAAPSDEPGRNDGSG